GRAGPNSDPGTKLAYAIGSLEFADSPQARRFAIQALSEGPVPQILEFGRHTAMELSPDGKWIAAGRFDGGLDLLADDGTAPTSLLESFRPNNYVQWKPQFSPDGKFLIWTWRGDFRVVKVWSLPDKKLVRTFQMEGLTRCFAGAGKVFFITDTTGRSEAPMIWGRSIVRIWNWDRNEPKLIGHLDLAGKDWKGFDIDSGGQSIAYGKENGVYVRSIEESGVGEEKLIGNHKAKAFSVRFHPGGKQLASVDQNGELWLWSMLPGAKNPIRMIAGVASTPPWFDPKGRFLIAPLNGAIAQWDLKVDGAEPLLYRSPDASASGIVDQQNRWLAVQAGSTLAFY
ncbi:MAG: WD40 repeat domain-containing protein, partial [Acidobacteriota bacterium]